MSLKLFRFFIWHNLPLWVASGGSVTKLQGGVVDFVELKKLGRFFGVFASQNDEEAGGEGVQRSGVTDFDFVIKLSLEKAANLSNYTKARNVGGFID